MNCKSCPEPCFEEVRCQECQVSGIWQGCAINGISEPNWFGLQHPLLNLTETCPMCRGRRYVRVFPEDLPCKDGDYIDGDDEFTDENEDYE